MSFLRGFLVFLLLSLALTGVLAQQQTDLQGQQTSLQQGQQSGQQGIGQQSGSGGQQMEGQEYNQNLLRLSQQFLDKMAKGEQSAAELISETAIFIPAIPGLSLSFGQKGFLNCQKRFMSLFKYSNTNCETKAVDPLRSSVYAECQISGMTYLPTKETVETLRMGFMLNWGGDGKLNRMVSVDKEGVLNQLVMTKAEEHLDTLIMAGVAHATAQKQKGGEEEEENIAFHKYYDGDDFDDDWHHPKDFPAKIEEAQQIRSGGQKQQHSGQTSGSGQASSSGQSLSSSSSSTSMQGGQQESGNIQSVSGGGQQQPVPQLDELIDDQIVVRFHQMPAFIRSLLQDQTELKGKQQVRDTMRRAKKHAKLLGFEIDMNEMNFRKVFATEDCVVVQLTVGRCQLAIAYKFNEQGHLVQKDVLYLGKW